MAGGSQRLAATLHRRPPHQEKLEEEECCRSRWCCVEEVVETRQDSSVTGSCFQSVADGGSKNHIATNSDQIPWSSVTESRNQELMLAGTSEQSSLEGASVDWTHHEDDKERKRREKENKYKKQRHSPEHSGSGTASGG